MSISTIGAAASLAAAFFLLKGRDKNNEDKDKDKVKSKKQALTATQELIRYKDISYDGIVELPGHKYRLVIEYEPVNFDLLSEQEQAALWVGFRDIINALTIPATFLVQSRHLDFKDYTNNLEKQVDEYSPTPEFKEFGKDHVAYLNEKTERNIRDRKHYIFLKFDALADSIDSGVKIDNEELNALVSDITSAFTKNKNVDDEEVRLLAHQELEEMSAIIQSILNSNEIPNIRLNRLGDMDFIYSALNRDIAPYARLVDADAQEMFSLTTRSLTPFMTGGGLVDRKVDEQNQTQEHEEKEEAI